MPNYTVAQPEGTKRAQLFETRRQGNGELVGVVPDESRYTGEGSTYRIRAANVLVHLGDDPPYGKVYGALIEPIRGRWIVPNYGTVYVFVPDVSVETKQRLGKALVQARRKVERIYDALHNMEWNTCYKHPEGNIAATYAHRPKGTDVLTMRTDASVGLRELVKIASHEIGHCVWHRILTADERAIWIKFFGRYVSVSTVDVGTIKKMVRDIRQIGGVRDYLSDCEAEDAAAAKIYLGWIRKVHNLSPPEVQDLVASGNELPIPDAHLHRSNTNTPVTLYSKESPPELFCEALSSHVVGDLDNQRMIKMLTGRA